MLLSICIPTYNRGHRAYALVKELLEKIDLKEDAYEIILSNNGSDKNTEGYEKLKKIKDSRFHYYEFSKNMRFWRNYNEVVKKSNGDWCLLISDEDNIIIDNLNYYIDIIKKYKNLGIIKEAGKSYHFEKEIYALSGSDSIEAFFLRGNYLSGVIYNRKIVTNELIDYLAEKYKENNLAYYYYPHMVVDLYVLLQADYFASNITLIDEGDAIDDQESYQNEEIRLPAYCTYESRLKQFKGFVNVIADIKTSEAMKFKCFMLLIDKYVGLILSSQNLMKQQVMNFMIGQIDYSGSKSVIENKSDFVEYIKQMVNAVL